MAAEDVELVRANLTRLRAEGFEALLPLIHPDFEMTTLPGLAAEPQTYNGREGMRRWWESFYDVMDVVELVPEEFHDAGDGLVVMAGRIEARGSASGLEVTQSVTFLCGLRDGLMASIEFFESVEAAKAATAADPSR